MSRFRDLLLSDTRSDLEVGWALAQDLGRPMAPLLWDQVIREGANVDKRLEYIQKEADRIEGSLRGLEGKQRTQQEEIAKVQQRLQKVQAEG